ncbi:LysM peptidoglycan-binding domain-containing protein [Spirosoma rhododendri]|uniref:LysM peptidoglycan-binding domain-containing protein n=1 Tax=Spirosoma rhododendri TaxID=2728024 RepID=A0A7L5DKB0_9BACT|nr:LysM peptidoglycan-binding domain-containing protein [Spirosoma rhododendri]QJD78904.1 LysM peptidoglycan-binding domain-containing protein [Spirosoma rhododendri]
MKQFLLSLFGLLVLSATVHARPVPFDSVGVEKKDGKRYILHRVDQGQTLFAIARRYKRSVSAIKAANPDMADAVRFDQVIRIPIPANALTPKQAVAIDKAIIKEDRTVKAAAKAADPTRTGIHVVEKGQTLYSLATRYGVSQDQLRQWNNLPSNSVLIGQALIVTEKAHLERVPGPSVAANTSRPATPERAETPKPEPRTAEPKPTAKAETPKAEAPKSEPKTEPKTEPTRTERPAEPKPTTKPATTEPASTRPTESRPTSAVPITEIELPHPGNDAPMPTRGRRLSTTGVAEMIDGTDGSGKYLALHRSAPVGTLVQVRNAFNNQSIWVKVIGRLPDTGVNDKILIKLSSQAFAKLSPDDRRFRAEVSYIAP